MRWLQSFHPRRGSPRIVLDVSFETHSTNSRPLWQAVQIVVRRWRGQSGPSSVMPPPSVTPITPGQEHMPVSIGSVREYRNSSKPVVLPYYCMENIETYAFQNQHRTQDRAPGSNALLPRLLRSQRIHPPQLYWERWDWLRGHSADAPDWSCSHADPPLQGKGFSSSLPTRPTYVPRWLAWSCRIPSGVLFFGQNHYEWIDVPSWPHRLRWRGW